MVARSERRIASWSVGPRPATASALASDWPAHGPVAPSRIAVSISSRWPTLLSRPDSSATRNWISVSDDATVSSRAGTAKKLDGQARRVEHQLCQVGDKLFQVALFAPFALPGVSVTGHIVRRSHHAAVYPRTNQFRPGTCRCMIAVGQSRFRSPGGTLMSIEVGQKPRFRVARSVGHQDQAVPTIAANPTSWSCLSLHVHRVCTGELCELRDDWPPTSDPTRRSWRFPAIPGSPEEVCRRAGLHVRRAVGTSGHTGRCQGPMACSTIRSERDAGHVRDRQGRKGGGDFRLSGSGDAPRQVAVRRGARQLV